MKNTKKNPRKTKTYYAFVHVFIICIINNFFNCYYRFVNFMSMRSGNLTRSSEIKSIKYTELTYYISSLEKNVQTFLPLNQVLYHSWV